MIRKFLILAVSIFVPVFLALQPIFPLIMESREITQSGESITQEWRFVSMPEFYDSARFAQTGWLDTTWNNYLILLVLNHVGLILVFFVVRNILNRFFGESK